MTKPKLAAVPVRILWMDDKPKTIENYKEILAQENKIEIEIATSISEAEEKIKDADGSLNSEAYEAFVVDCQMDPLDLTENGAKFLKEVNDIDKSFPTFVYSAWSQDPRYKKYLDQSYAILIEPRISPLEHPLLEHPFFKQVYETSHNYRQVKKLEPEKITFEAYVNNPRRYENEVCVHWKKHGHWITKDLTRANWRWGVACGDELVAGSDDLFDYPTDKKLMQMGESHNLIPFAYSVPILPEDTPARSTTAVSWNPTASKNDYYPAIRVKIGNTELRDDFDTGAEQTVVTEDLVKKGILGFLREYSTDLHLGDKYEFLTKQIEISLFDSDGQTVTKELPVAVVKDWIRSPFTKINGRRRALLGRDLLRAFQIEICLDSQNRVTQVRFLE